MPKPKSDPRDPDGTIARSVAIYPEMTQEDWNRNYQKALDEIGGKKKN